MVPVKKFEFQVDEQFENEKGIFTVIAIHRNEMVIRWQSGEEIRTDIDLQRNIQVRRQWEETNRKTKAAQKSVTEGKQQGFIGFMPGDFKNSANGTNWRGRTRLGGEVAALLSQDQDRFAFHSWAFAQKPELHWLDINHYRNLAVGGGARFFVRLTPSELIYGLCVRRDHDKNQNGRDWRAFTRWVALEENAAMLLSTSHARGLSISDRNRPASGILLPSDKGWRLEDGPKGKSMSVVTFIDQLSENGDTLLEVALKMEKIDAVARGNLISNDIADLLSMLMPAYTAAVVG